MSTVHDVSTSAAKPAFWYDIPHGYLQMDVYPTAERMEELAQQILALPEDVRDRADQVFRLYATVLWEMQKKRVQGCAIGMHPDEQGNASTSVLTVFSVETQGVNPKAALTTLMASGHGEDADSGLVPMELPCGLGFLTDTVRRATPPGRRSAGGEGGEPEGERVWQGMVAIPDVRSSAIIVIQLTSASLELADDYRNVLRGVATTVSFTNPALAGAAGEAVEPLPGSAAEAVRNDFG